MNQQLSRENMECKLLIAILRKEVEILKAKSDDNSLVINYIEKENLNM